MYTSKRYIAWEMRYSWYYFWIISYSGYLYKAIDLFPVIDVVNNLPSLSMQTEGMPQEVLVKPYNLYIRIAYFRNKKLNIFKTVYF